MSKALTIVFALLCLATAASSKETEPNPVGAPDAKESEPRATGKPVTTTKISRCPEGYELIYRVNGVERGCAKDTVPTTN
jgi:hypothetical protein